MNNPDTLPVIRSQLQQLVFKEGIQQTQNPYSQKVFDQLSKCHTAATGFHLNRCNNTDCQHQQHQYHNCGNRHCPNCGGMKREQWLEDKTSELLPTAYFHVVFTLPHELNGLIMGNRKTMFKLLFDAASYTILTLAKDPQWLGATPGIISILHTWGQDLSFHPHVHCIVSGGGILGNEWVTEKRKSKKYLFPPKAMQSVYKGYYLKQLRLLIANKQLDIPDEKELFKTIRQIGFKQWNVYAKAPFGSPLQVLEYLGRYTHKVAITAHRIIAINEQTKTIRFKYKDYHARGTDKMHKELTLPIAEFNRRFEQHILPAGFVKIRHYGYLKNYQRTQRLKAMFETLKLPPPPPKVQVQVAVRMMEKHSIDIHQCPMCKTGRMETVATYRKGILCTTNQPVSPNKEAKNKASP